MRPRLKLANPREAAVLAAVAALALVVRLDRIGWSLPSVYEEATPFKKAWDMWGLGSLWGFGPLRGFDPNPHWFQYPSLIFYVQLLGQAVTIAALWLVGAVRSTLDLRALYLIDKTPFYLVGRSITALFGAATVLPAWGLARRVAGFPAAVLAGLFVALHPALIAKSKVIEVDVPLTFFVTLGLLLAVRLAERATIRSALGAGAVAGLAASAKYPGFALLGPMLFALWRSRGVAGARPRQGPGGPSSEVRSRSARPARRAPSARRSSWAGRAVALVAVCIAVFFLTSPYLLLSPAEARRDLAIGRQLMTLGHFGIAAGTAYGTYLHDWFASLMGWPLGIAALAGLAWAAARGTAWGLTLAALFAPYVVVVGSWQMKADRYLLPLVPLGAVCGAALIGALASLPALWARARLGAGALALCGVACLAPLVAQLPAQRAALGEDTRQLARRWIEQHLAPGSLVASELYGPDLMAPLELQESDDALLARLRTDGRLKHVDALQVMPMFVMAPERSDKFYRMALYSTADAVVVTSSVRERYRAEPSRYAPQLAFYDSLAARWPEAARFEPHGTAGPAIAIHVNPASATPFGARGTMPAVDSTLATDGKRSGSEGFWYYNLGLNAEWFGYTERAREAYLLALRFGASEPSMYVRAAVRLAALLRREGHAGQALGMLLVCSRRAPGRAEAGELRQAATALRTALVAGGAR